MKILRSVWLLTLASATAQAGGVSGGGGDTKPTRPTTEAVRSVIKDARFVVTTYFNWDQKIASPNPNEKEKIIQEKLYGTPGSTVMEKIAAVRIREELTGPCYDVEGNPADGSVELTKSPAVCLSIPRLQEKLVVENYEKEILALVVHEYSHLVSATEEEAEFLQEIARYRMDWRGFSLMPDVLKTFVKQKKYLDQTIEQLSISLEKQSWDKNSDHVKNVAILFLPFLLDHETGEGFFNLFSKDFSAYLKLVVMEKVGSLNSGTCALANFRESDHCRKEVRQIFRGASEVSYLTYMSRRYPGEEHLTDVPSVIFRRIRNHATARAELSDLKELLQQLSAQLSGLEKLRENAPPDLTF